MRGCCSTELNKNPSISPREPNNNSLAMLTWKVLFLSSSMEKENHQTTSVVVAALVDWFEDFASLVTHDFRRKRKDIADIRRVIIRGYFRKAPVVIVIPPTSTRTPLLTAVLESPTSVNQSVSHYSPRHNSHCEIRPKMSRPRWTSNHRGYIGKDGKCLGMQGQSDVSHVDCVRKGREQKTSLSCSPDTFNCRGTA